ncbi:YbjP/YqhG family protein [Pseudomonas silvicola]|nr:YbjP/YqhG family protein [Pseudomonas silvicola]
MKRLLSLLCVLAGLHLSIAAADAPSAQQTTQAFYAWYLKRLNDDKVPLNDNPQQMQQYVADSLIKAIDKQAKSEDGLDEDYFIKSQDIDDSWLTHIQVTETATKGATAQENVVLGTTQDNSQVLNVTLGKDKDAWKITAVEVVPTEQ